MTPEATPRTLTTRRHEPLLAVMLEEDGQEVVRYFAGDVPTDADQSADDIVEEALQLAGAWRDLDWPQTAAALDRIRHASPPTPPIEL